MYILLASDGTERETQRPQERNQGRGQGRGDARKRRALEIFDGPVACDDKQDM